MNEVDVTDEHNNTTELEEAEAVVSFPVQNGDGSQLRFQLRWSSIVHIAVTVGSLLVLFTTLRADVEKLKTESVRRDGSERELGLKLDSIETKLDILNTRHMIIEQRVQELSDRMWDSHNPRLGGK